MDSADFQGWTTTGLTFEDWLERLSLGLPMPTKEEVETFKKEDKELEKEI